MTWELDIGICILIDWGKLSVGRLAGSIGHIFRATNRQGRPDLSMSREKRSRRAE